MSKIPDQVQLPFSRNGWPTGWPATWLASLPGAALGAGKRAHSGLALVMAWNCSLANGGIKTSRVGGAARAGYAAGGPRSAPQTSAMSTIPIQPVPSPTGNCRKPPCTMVVAASRMLVAAEWLPGGRSGGRGSGSCSRPCRWPPPGRYRPR